MLVPRAFILGSLALAPTVQGLPASTAESTPGAVSTNLTGHHFNPHYKPWANHHQNHSSHVATPTMIVHNQTLAATPKRSYPTESACKLSVYKDISELEHDLALSFEEYSTIENKLVVAEEHEHTDDLQEDYPWMRRSRSYYLRMELLRLEQLQHALLKEIKKAIDEQRHGCIPVHDSTSTAAEPAGNRTTPIDVSHIMHKPPPMTSSVVQRGIEEHTSTLAGVEPSSNSATATGLRVMHMPPRITPAIAQRSVELQDVVSKEGREGILLAGTDA